MKESDNSTQAEMKYNGDDGRSHSNRKQEVHPFTIYEMWTLEIIMVVFFAVSNKEKRNYYWVVSFLRAEAVLCSALGPKTQLKTIT